ncbi:hypothetical protein SSX86_030150 [Deinandra increscens subsp. villosa]|uniref:Uncharacterized protein n=1 Tax=Deinandra increscens subsp. villosa TaxID=3103831 RepID=A0AAP0GIU6_9ASTR
MQKHVVLCTELKQLYMVITRARQRLWICVSTGFSEPIYDYWKKLSLDEVRKLSGSFADEIKIPSSKTEWRSRGFKLFYETNFSMAQICFSKAYHLRAIGGDALVSQLERKKILKDAAELFSPISKKLLAAECFYEMEDYETVGGFQVIGMWNHCGRSVMRFQVCFDSFSAAFRLFEAVV